MRKRIVRKKAHRVIQWKSIFGCLVVINLAIACQFSKVTSLRTISLVNVRYTERERVSAMIAEVEGIPALQLKPRKIEKRFTGQSRVLSADFRRNIFGRGSLTLVYRTPVAELVDRQGVFLDKTGYVFGDPEIKPNVPKLKLDKAMSVSVVALAGVINYGEVAELATLVQEKLVSRGNQPNSFEIEVADTGGVSVMMQGVKIVIGTCEALEKKITALSRLISTNPNVFNEITEINLMAPDKPSIKRKIKETQ